MNQNSPARTKNQEAVVSIYGNIKIPKAYREHCGAFSFVIDGILSCCDRALEFEARRYKRESEPEQRRKLPPVVERRAQLELQGNRCFYCGRSFGSYVFKNLKTTRLLVHFDHLLPYVYSQNNHSRNFVASCQICNQIKRDKCFQTVEEAQIFILNRWEEKGIV